MTNKKLLAVATIALVISTTSAFAKTEGNYAGVNAIRSDSSNQYKVVGFDVGNDFDDKAIGFGADYRHAFNLNNFFIAPGVFAEKNGTESKDLDGDTVSIDYRYGLKADIGYDINDDFSVYFTNGFSRTKYTVDWKSVDSKKSDTASGYFYGAGVSYAINKDVAINLEYNTQMIELDTPANTIKVDSQLSVIKLGASYHF
ncbi:MAG: outer membrane beta-barrel protein [Pseudomonadota bacterium]